MAEINRISYDRITYRYKTVHDLCKLILDNFSLNFEEGNKKFYSFVINSWNIYEIFLREIYKKFSHNFSVKGYKTSQNNESQRAERPDIVICQKNKDIIYIDAKYKIKPTRDDRNQLNWYITQVNELPYGELIYPKLFQEQTGYEEGRDNIVKIRFIELSKISNEEYLKEFVNKTFQDYFSFID